MLGEFCFSFWPLLPPPPSITSPFLPPPPPPPRSQVSCPPLQRRRRRKRPLSREREKERKEGGKCNQDKVDIKKGEGIDRTDGRRGRRVRNVDCFCAEYIRPPTDRLSHAGTKSRGEERKANFLPPFSANWECFFCSLCLFSPPTEKKRSRTPPPSLPTFLWLTSLCHTVDGRGRRKIRACFFGVFFPFLSDRRFLGKNCCSLNHARFKHFFTVLL